MKFLNKFMKYIFVIFILFFSLVSSLHASNVSIKQNFDLDLNCKFEKVIIKNTDYNFVEFNSNQVSRKSIKKLIIKTRNPNLFVVKNLSKFFGETKLEVKVSNKDIVLLQAFSEDRNYSESAILTLNTGELIHEITKNIKGAKNEKEKDISFFKCRKNKDNI